MSAYFLSLCCICIALDNGTGLVGNTHQTNIMGSLCATATSYDLD